MVLISHEFEESFDEIGVHERGLPFPTSPIKLTRSSPTKPTPFFYETLVVRSKQTSKTLAVFNLTNNVAVGSLNVTLIGDMIHQVAAVVDPLNFEQASSEIDVAADLSANAVHGFIQYEISSSVVYLSFVYVQNDYRNQGIGRHLVSR